MFKGYLFNEAGMYQAPVYLDDEVEVLRFGLRYKDIAPRIMITLRDESVFESDHGQIVFPEISQEKINRMSGTFVPMPKNLVLEELLNSYKEKVEAFVASKGSDREEYKAMVLVENDLMALASRDGINLSEYGWKNSGIIDAELDCGKGPFIYTTAAQSITR